MTRSTVESKNAPRWLDAPDALASAPSSRSGRAARITSIRPERDVAGTDRDRRADADEQPDDGQVVGRQTASCAAPRRAA